MSRTLKINIPARDQKVYACFVEQKKLYPNYKYIEVIKIVAGLQGLGCSNTRRIIEYLFMYMEAICFYRIKGTDDYIFFKIKGGFRSRKYLIHGESRWITGIEINKRYPDFTCMKINEAWKFMSFVSIHCHDNTAIRKVITVPVPEF